MSGRQTIIFDWGRTLYDPDTKALFRDTKQVLAGLKEKGYRLAIVSLATAGETKIRERWQIIEREQLEPYFDRILFGGANKEKLYQQLFDEWSLDRSSTIIVDDYMIRGIQWGNQKGCTTVWYQNGKNADVVPTAQTGDPTYTITSLGQLLNLL